MDRPRRVVTPKRFAQGNFLLDWGALQQGLFFPLWASAAVDEILSALHERIVVGEASTGGS